MKTNQSIKLGISSCLLGNSVRYDGGHKLDHYLRHTLGQFIQWVPVCPEVECGLPVPREAMDLLGDMDLPRLITRVTGVDHTARMQQWTKKKLSALEQEGLCGFVLKARSPSCGVHDSKVYSKPGRVAGGRAGLFAEAVMGRFPFMPMEDEEGLQDPGIRENFIERLLVYCRWQEFLAQGGSIGQLVVFHSQHKYLLMAHSAKHLKALGNLVAEPRKYKQPELLDHYFTLLMESLSLPATIRKQTNVLQHMTGYFKKQLSSSEKLELHEVITKYYQGLVPLIVPITLITHYAGKYDDPYLKEQRYLNPHPLELMLKNHA
jgi:uncharacterized protein YbgA (DUF1722 family)/uncharacterized protein YbbK (DUF523 family)